MGLITGHFLWTISNKPRTADLLQTAVLRVIVVASLVGHQAMQLVSAMQRALRKLSAIVLTTIIVLASSCQPKPDSKVEVSTNEKKPAPPAVVDPEAEKREVAWRRMKECAEQVEQIAKQAKWVEWERFGNAKDGYIMITGWRNHYSPKYGRCYVHVTYATETPDPYSIIPSFYDELYDAFERTTKSTCTDDVGKATALYCNVESEEGANHDCRACRQYVKDRMDN